MACRAGICVSVAIGCAVGPQLALAGPPSPGIALFAPDSEWIKHRVVAKETLDWIAARYGVTRSQIVRWNKKKLGTKAWIYAGQKLSIHAPKPVPPPRVKVRYRVKRGDTWSKIASHYDVPLKQLRAWNAKVPRAFKAGTRLVVWTNPAPVPIKSAKAGEAGEVAMPSFDVESGGLSIGKPNRGSLQRGVPLPDSEMYLVRDAEKAFGASHAIEQMLTAFANFRAASGYEDQLVIGAMSLKRGGRFRPHRSHQSGRDVDIRMPRKPGRKKIKSANDIDWGMTWGLIKALAETGEVEYIFMSTSRQRLLYRAARDSGASRAEMAKLIQYPGKAKTNKGLVRHAKGHDSHIHVRFKCAGDNKRCESY
ncbi:MAG: penicillin-insensitive murein endopeptidase [Nannocystaceae bacterium]|nr:penicillin-insensitive murein endopeptidase [Nannocystaceae bacterium]